MPDDVSLPTPAGPAGYYTHEEGSAEGRRWCGQRSGSGSEAAVIDDLDEEIEVIQILHAASSTT